MRGAALAPAVATEGGEAVPVSEQSELTGMDSKDTTQEVTDGDSN